MKDLFQDLRLALRTTRRSLGLTSVIVITLGLGIGANTAIFGLLDRLLLRTLPVADPERLVVVDAPGPFSGSSHSGSQTLTPMSHPMFEELSERNAVFSGMLAHYPTSAHLTAGDRTDAVDCDLVSGSFFQVLAVLPATGRLLTPADDQQPGPHPVVVLSHAFWSRRFGKDPEVVGRRVLVNGHSMTVVGVSAEGFQGVEVGMSVDVFVPLMEQGVIVPTWRRGVGDWRTRWLMVMARLGEGVTVEQAQAGVNVLYRHLLREDLHHLPGHSESFRARYAGKELVLLPGARGTSELRTALRVPLLLLMGMVGLVLLVACADVSNLLLARASVRRREIALRVALGATRLRLVRQLLVESVVLSLLGGVVGLVLAAWSGALLLRWWPREQLGAAVASGLDFRILAFGWVLSLVTGLLFGLVPASRASRPDLAPTLRSESGSLVGRTANRFREGLVVGQVSLSLLLLIGAGLFARSLIALRSIDPGFEPDHLLQFSVDPALNGYPVERSRSLLEEIRAELATEPGVEAVSLARIALLTNSDWSSTIEVEGYEPREGEDMNPNLNAVAPGFFPTLGMPLVAGRDLSSGDRTGAPLVAVVNEELAEYYFGGASDAVGRHFSFGRGGSPVEIVGVVRDGKSATLREAHHRFVYLPFTQVSRLGEVTFYLRCSVDPEGLEAQIRSVVTGLDPTLPVTGMEPVGDQVRASLAVEWGSSSLSMAFASLATLLAAVGLYGLMSFSVSRRSREIGLRMALGAGRRSLLLGVLREAMLLTGLGIALALPAALGIGALLRTQLYASSAVDPWVVVLACAILFATSLLAGYAPAARAAGVDPMVVLRQE